MSANRGAHTVVFLGAGIRIATPASQHRYLSVFQNLVMHTGNTTSLVGLQASQSMAPALALYLQSPRIQDELSAMTMPGAA